MINQQKHPIHLPHLQQLAEHLASPLPDLTQMPWSEITILLLDDEGITLPNQEYFGKNRPTDVISFRYDPIPGETPALSGDLLINVQRALEAGSAHHGSNYELALYIAHGIDHLSGSEDDTPEKRAAMLATETQWLKKAQTHHLLARIFHK